MQGHTIKSIVGIALFATVALPAEGQRTPESTTLFVCQRQAGAQAGRYAFVRQRLLGACLGRVAADVILQNETAIDVERSARGCLGPLYALGRTDGRSQRDIMTDRINRFCDPSESFPQHSEDDVLGTGAPGVNQPLDAATLDTWCGNLATGSSTLAEWVECMRAAAECSAHQQIVSAYPRVLEWLDLVDAELASSTHPFSAEARAELQAVEAAIDGASDDALPDIVCGPSGAGLVPGVDPILPATGQTTSYGTGSDGDVQAGQARSFTDNGDGTITDNTTGLMWEKKVALDSDVDLSNPHDANNCYDWSGTCTGDGSTECLTDTDCTVVGGSCSASGCDGTDDTIFEWVAALNASNFAGYNDWRIPNINELLSILNLERYDPAIHTAFHAASCGSTCTDIADPACSCDSSSVYWTSTANRAGGLNGDDDNGAMYVRFSDGIMALHFKDYGHNVRAVRGGL